MASMITAARAERKWPGMMKAAGGDRTKPVGSDDE
jgi:hypothetical protein